MVRSRPKNRGWSADLCPAARAQTLLHARSQPAVQRHLRGLRAYPQTGLRIHQQATSPRHNGALKACMMPRRSDKCAIGSLHQSVLAFMGYDSTECATSAGRGLTSNQHAVRHRATMSAAARPTMTPGVVDPPLAHHQAPRRETRRFALAMPVRLDARGRRRYGHSTCALLAPMQN